MIGYYPGTIWLDFAIDWVKGQGQGHEKVNIFLNRMKFGGMIGYYPGPFIFAPSFTVCCSFALLTVDMFWTLLLTDCFN